jgi:hypothetical protein
MIQKSSVSFALAAVLGMAAGAPAQTLEEVLARNIEARGGLERIRGTESVRMSGTMTLGPGLEAPFKIELKRPNRMRVEFVIDGQTGIQATDGTAAWGQMPFTGTPGPVILAPGDAKSLMGQADLDGPLVDHAAKGHKVELVGKEAIPGGEAYRIKLTMKDGETRAIFIDSVSFLEVRGEGRRSTPRGEMEFVTRLTDHKPVDGLVLPFALESGPKDRPERQRMTLTKIERNVALDDAQFAVPKDARPAPAGRPDR